MRETADLQVQVGCAFVHHDAKQHVEIHNRLRFLRSAVIGHVALLQQFYLRIRHGAVPLTSHMMMCRISHIKGCKLGYYGYGV
jgi:hypothetical protein